MNRRPNRAILVLVSIVLIGLGLLPLLAAGGTVQLERPADSYLRIAAGAQANPWVWLLGVAGIGLILAALGAWLVARQLAFRRGGRLSTVVLQRQDKGRTTLQAAAAAGAAAADLRRRRPIEDSGVRLLTFGSRPRLLVDLVVSVDTELDRALEAAEEVYERLVRVLGVDAVNVDTRLRPRATEQSRVL